MIKSFMTVFYQIETIAMICSANQWTVFYVIDKDPRNERVKQSQLKKVLYRKSIRYIFFSKTFVCLIEKYYVNSFDSVQDVHHDFLEE